MMGPLLLLLAIPACLSWSSWHESNCDGNREAIVHLFEWKWTDIAAECERFLGPMGYCGVQVSPANEHIVAAPFRPWWERYQPVSYKLTSRSGTEKEFINMVERCNNVGVRIYVDVILNHMAGVDRSGIGIAGSEFDANEGEFPGVPYKMEHFHGCDVCPGCCCVNSWTDWDNVRLCRLVGLIDMDQKNDYVIKKQAEFLNTMIDIGVAGFRVDAAKHMYPEDLEVIWGRLHNLNTRWFPANKNPFMFLEVIDMDQQGEVRAQWYTHLGRVTDFRYCIKISQAAGSLWDIQGIYDPGWGMLPPEDAFVFVDNHDNQRGHGGGGATLTFKSPYKYKMAQALTLGWNYGYPRIMSSYFFTDSEAGPPSDENGNTKNVIITPDGGCDNGWVCEHRWKPIAGMASFSKAVHGTGVENWWGSGNRIAFSRGNKGFFAASNTGLMDEVIYTGLPAGDYCNVIEGCPTDSGCTGDVVTVGNDGKARIKMSNSDEPQFAIHVEAMSGSGSCTSDGGTVPSPPTQEPTSEPTSSSAAPETSKPTDGPPTEPPTGDWRRTVIFIKAETQIGQDLFLRGGINHDRRPGCTDEAATSACAISITHNDLGSSSHYDSYNTWRVGDSKLDWYGAESGQSWSHGRRPEGTPTAWTSNRPNSPGYQPMNIWGDHYWMVDLEMNCAETENGWFEFKSYITNRGWENDVTQTKCGGNIGGSAPHKSNNHLARCGYTNVYKFNEGVCEIDKLYSYTSKSLENEIEKLNHQF